MANEIQIQYQSGKNVYAIIRNAVSQVWNNNTQAFETYSSASYSSYSVSLTEQGTSGFYAGSFPTAITAGVFSLVGKQQLGGSVQETDPTIANGDLQWNGASTLPLSNLATSGQIGQGMPIRIARGTMIKPFGFSMVSATDHVTPFTSGTISGQISRDGGAFGALQSGAFTEVGNGFYSLQALTSGDMLANNVLLLFTANGISGGTSDPRSFSIVTQRTSGSA
jgi:hypothetical protein